MNRRSWFAMLAAAPLAGLAAMRITQPKTLTWFARICRKPVRWEFRMTGPGPYYCLPHPEGWREGDEMVYIHEVNSEEAA